MTPDMNHTFYPTKAVMLPAPDLGQKPNGSEYVHKKITPSMIMGIMKQVMA